MEIAAVSFGNAGNAARYRALRHASWSAILHHNTAAAKQSCAPHGMMHASLVAWLCSFDRLAAFRHNGNHETTGNRGAGRPVNCPDTGHSAARRLLSAVLCSLLVGTFCLACSGLSAERAEWQLNETVQSQGWRVTVFSMSALPDDPYRRPLDGHTFVAVQLKIENISQEIRYVMPEQQMTLVDGQGQTYALDYEAAVVAARTLDWLIPEGEFVPGAAAHGATSYQIPLGACDLRWVFRTTLPPGAPTVTFALGDAPQP
jgi:hypothetical protein